MYISVDKEIIKKKWPQKFCLQCRKIIDKELQQQWRDNQKSTKN
jgi:hypothetical protein